MNERIEVNPKVLCGKPVVAGTRIPVYLVLNLLANGYDLARIIEAYPVLTEADIQACLSFAEARLRYEETFSLDATPALVPA